MSIKLSAMNGHYRYFTLESFFSSISKIGFKNCEIWTCPQHFFVDYNQNDDVNELIELKNKYGINIQCICPEQTNPKPHNIAAKKDSIKERTFSYYKRIIDIARAVGAEKILTTSGWGYLDEEREEALARSVEMQRKICDYAKSNNIIVCLEALQNIESNIVNSVEDVSNYLKLVDSDNLYVCIDFGAMAKSNNTIDEYFDELKDKIRHIHFVDGKPTGHLAIGDGERDYSKDVNDLLKNNYDGYITFETVVERYFRKPFEADKQSYTNIMGVLK